jgi:hypothetical protein
VHYKIKKRKEKERKKERKRKKKKGRKGGGGKIIFPLFKKLQIILSFMVDLT